MCVSCRRRDVARWFIRVVRRPDGSVILDESGKTDGRGAYVCPELLCIETARRRRCLDRALRCHVPDDVYRSLVTQASGAPHHER
ncbi:MAG: nucleic acid-binding protein [Dethiosulfovibrio peptidovorans]|nr:MAG: nucleic acid-binding protein [Dethiosulfovibrio peptidovorans]